MLAYCGRPRSVGFCDPFPYIVPRYARETIAETYSIWVALATAIVGQTGSRPHRPLELYGGGVRNQSGSGNSAKASRSASLQRLRMPRKYSFSESTLIWRAVS